MKLKPFNLAPESHLKPEIDGFYQTKYWKGISKIQLMEHPLCEICEAKGLTRSATIVDHKIPRRQGGSDLPFNLQSLCYGCHQIKSAGEGREEMYNRNPKWIK